MFAFKTYGSIEIVLCRLKLLIKYVLDFQIVPLGIKDFIALKNVDIQTME